MSLVKLSIVLAAAAWHDSAPSTAVVPRFEEPPVRSRGMASWYGDGAMHGRVTASGEEIDPERFTCAHRTLPLQTTVLLVNVNDPTRRTWCRVNDRGPYGAKTVDGSYRVKTDASAAGRWRGILDISVAAARALGTYGKGLEPVEVRYWARRSRSAQTVAVAAPPNPDE